MYWNQIQRVSSDTLLIIGNLQICIIGYDKDDSVFYSVPFFKRSYYKYLEWH